MISISLSRVKSLSVVYLNLCQERKWGTTLESKPTKERRYPMKKKLVITSLPQAFEMIKQMNLSGGEWEADYRVAGRHCRGFWKGRCETGLTVTWRKWSVMGRKIGEMAASHGIY